MVQVVTDRNTHIVRGRIVHAHADASVWKDGRVDPRLLDPVCRLAGSGYVSLGEFSASTGRNGRMWRELEARR
jgi:flavin reductase (DIM6/NTAB) family NADH-FMN oxidoreductase RutF